MLREEKSFVLKYIKHKSKSNRFCIFIFIKLLHVQSIYSSHFVVVSHVSICILNKTLFVLMLSLQIKTKNPVIFFLLLIVFSLQIYSYMQFIFTFKLQKSYSLDFLKTQSKDQRIFCNVVITNALTSIYVQKKKVINSTLSKFAHFIVQGYLMINMFNFGRHLDKVGRFSKHIKRAWSRF